MLIKRPRHSLITYHKINTKINLKPYPITYYTTLTTHEKQKRKNIKLQSLKKTVKNIYVTKSKLMPPILSNNGKNK